MGVKLKSSALFFVCLFCLLIFTTACGGGGGSGSSGNSALYYPFAQQNDNSNNNSNNSNNNNNNSNNTLEVSKSLVSVSVGSTDSVTVSLNGSDVTSNVTYTVADSSIATVNKGTITGVAEGTTTVTVSYKNAKSATFVVNVLKYTLEVSKSLVSVSVGSTDSVIVLLNGSDVTNNATYTISDKSIATVNKGRITGVSEGTTTVTVSYKNAKSAIFVVNVVKYNLEVSKSFVHVSVGSTDSVTVSLNGSTLTSGLTYEVADESIATVDNGTVTGVSEGTTTVTVYYNNAKSAIFVVSVGENILNVSKSLVSVSVGTTDSVTVSLNGATLTSGLTYEVADESIATVANGTITGVGEGTTTVTVSYNNAKSAIFVVNVVKYSLEVSKSLVSVSVGSTDSVTVSLNGSNVTSGLTYEVADESIATVNNGTITGVDKGTTIVTVSYNNAKSAIFVVNVGENILEISKSLVSVSVGSTDSVTVSLNGSTVTSGLTYELADESIATVNNGTITGIGEGTTTVTVSYNNANSAIFVVNVVKYSLMVSKSLVSLGVGSTDSVTVSLNGSNVTSGLTYEVADESIATVTNGTITGLAKGSTTVTVSYNNAKSAIFVVSVGENILEVSKNLVSVSVGSTDSVIVSLNGTTLTSGLTYTVADESIATVNNGTITGVGEGTTTVTISYNNAKSAIFVVNVVKYNLKVSKSLVSVSVGSTDSVTVSLNGTTLTSDLTYTVADESIATVNNGTITGVGEGTTTVTISYNNAKSAIFVVNVVKYNLKVSKSLVSVSVGSTDSVTVSLNGTTLTSDLTYTVADESIATVNNGTITGVGEGTTTVTVSYNNAKSAIFVVNVLKYSLEVSKKLVSVSVGSTDSVTVSLNGETVTSGLTYEVADQSIATVNNGTITGVSAGSTTVTVSLENVNSVTFTVSVVKYNLEVSKKLVSVSVGSTDSVTVSLNGETVTSGLTYTVADESIATVTNGTITGVGAGSTTVTVSLDNVNSATFIVSVVKYSLEVSKNLVSISVGNTDSVTVSLNGTTLTSGLTYTVADESIATVNNGTITGVSKGITTVTVSYNNANSAIFVVNVGVDNILEVSKELVTVGVGFTDSVTVSLNGEPVTSDVTYTVADQSIARVVNGTVTGVSEGITTVTVSSNNANSAIFVVHVVKYNLEVSKNVVNVSVGTTDSVTVSLHGQTVTSGLTYEVADETIATVTNGTVTGVGAGSTTVTVSHPNANSATFEVNVVKYSLEVSKNVVNISVATTDSVVVSLNGTTVTNAVTYTVADGTIATVENGTVTGIRKGSTTVTVSLTNVNSPMCG